jgi:hypothetical protein
MDAALWQLNEADVSRLGHLNALKLDVQAKVQGYQSQVMKAQGMKMIADLDKASMDTFIGINQKNKSFMEEHRHNVVTESVQAQARRDALAASQAKAASERADAMQQRMIRDPATGKPVGQLLGGTPAQVSEYNVKQAGAYSATRNLLKFKDVTARVGKLWKSGNFLSTPEAAELRAIHSDLISDIIRSKTGAAATDAERANLEKILPLDKIGQPDNTRTIENYVNKIADDRNAENSATLAPLEGEQTLSYDFKSSTDRTDPGLPDEGMNTAALKLQASRNPGEIQSAVRDVLEAARDGASVDTGRAGIEKLKTMLEQIPVEQRSIPDVNGDIDPVRELETILATGQAFEGARNTAPSAPTEPYYQGD